MVDVPDEQAAQMAAASFEALRRQTGGEELSLVPDLRLQRIAQTMAEREAPNSSAALALPGVRFAASYATLDPSEPAAGRGAFDRFARSNPFQRRRPLRSRTEVS